MKKTAVLAYHSFKELIRKKDFYVFLFLSVGLILFFYTESFFGIQDTARYLKDIGFSIIFLFSMVITISFSAKQIQSEIDAKTIYPLMAKPISRAHFILGKYFGSLLISIGSFTVFYALYLTIIVSKGEGADFLLAAQTYFFTALLFCFLSAVTIFFSLFLTLSANITVTFLLYFVMRWFNSSIRELITISDEKISYAYSVLYYLLPHFEFYDIKIRLVHAWDPLPLWVVLSVTAYTILYIKKRNL